MDGVPETLLDAADRRALLNAADTLPRELLRRSIGLELPLQGPTTGDLVVAAAPSTSDDREALERTLMLGALSGERSVWRLASAL